MAQAVSIKQEELENISRIMMQRKGDVIKIYHYPEFHLFIAFDPLNEKDLHVMDINTVGPMIDYYLGERYRITEMKKIDDKKVTGKEVEYVNSLFKKMDDRNQLEREILEFEVNGNYEEAMKIIKFVLDDRNTLIIKIEFLQGLKPVRWTIKRVDNIHWRINDDPDSKYPIAVMLDTFSNFIKKRILFEFRVN